MIKLDNQLETIDSYLSDKKWLEENEKVASVEKPGEGNMNFTLRCRTSNDHSFIIKQSRDFVEKFPQVPAPAERVLRESEFYEIIRKNPDLSRRTPEIIAVDEENHIILMEDLGESSDYSFLYQEGKNLSETELKEIMHFIADLHTHFTTDSSSKTIQNKEMRQLNHEHIFKFPFMKDNGMNLDDVMPGLEAVKQSIIRNEALHLALKQLGDLYLSDGKHLLHGDYFPGSWLNTKSGLKIIDPEFCFFGPKEFEIGVCMAHLYLAKQPYPIIQKAMDFYKEKAPFDDVLMMKFMAVEMMRRILGLAQLPISQTLEERKALVERGVMMLTKY
ncbi:phosphotransferase [Marivirga harenae]|uniref:phosphotransferase n=1 Tax=Marivirga harenae TaxID=2010992 RepID=UPI0026E0F0C0|nr:phosphotransferase [Marivirga harenae]WKV12467.1 phosphotransferase [Marivirga harenae]|tara:strand:- start:65449 stop:66441 length:993 start_codon:yes stop_codon:yes gene_type:complete